MSTKEQIDFKLASIIDHTLLKAQATYEDLVKLCDEAVKYHFATVCVNTSNIETVTKLLQDSQVKPIAVVGFPLGATTSYIKACETKEAINCGAQEIDMVINIGALKSKDYACVYRDIKIVVDTASPYKVKAILETALLEHEEKIAACVLAKAAGAAFVKTSTGFGPSGATIEDIILMRKIIGADMQIKASGGIRTKEDAQKMITAGANRLGTSAGVIIVTTMKA